MLNTYFKAHARTLGCAALLLVAGEVSVNLGQPLIPQAFASQAMAVPQESHAWRAEQALVLLELGTQTATEGLAPEAYRANSEAVRAALEGADQRALNQAATALYFQLAQDFLQGHTPLADRKNWHYPLNNWPTRNWPLDDAQASLTQQEAAHKYLQAALRDGRIAQSLQELLPQHPDYKALKAVLATLAPEQTTQRQAVLASLEQWRWLPRDFGMRYLFVNVPEYSLEMIENGVRVARHRVIVGKPSTPTLLFADHVTNIILNPSWEVPPTILSQMVAPLLASKPDDAEALGYSPSYDVNNALVQVIQKPGGTNPMGQVKFVMPGNSFDILLHDTPYKALFAENTRTFSFGCVRVEKPFELVLNLLRTIPGWNQTRLDQWRRLPATLNIDLQEEAIPIYIVYLTARMTPAGLTIYPNVYAQDKS